MIVLNFYQVKSLKFPSLHASRKFNELLKFKSSRDSEIICGSCLRFSLFRESLASPEFCLKLSQSSELIRRKPFAPCTGHLLIKVFQTVEILSSLFNKVERGEQSWFASISVLSRKSLCSTAAIREKGKKIFGIFFWCCCCCARKSSQKESKEISARMKGSKIALWFSPKAFNCSI